MAFDWVQLVRFLHVLAAAVWFGGVAFSVLLIGPAVKAAGPVGGQFMGFVQKRGGFARIMGPVAGLVLLTGFVLYWEMGYSEAPFASTPAALLSIGALAGLGGWLFGLAFVMPLQKRMQATSAQLGPGGPTPEQAASMKAVGERMARRGNVFVVLITAAMVLMAGRSVFA